MHTSRRALLGATTPAVAQRSCLFLDLPLELRDEIYSYLLPSYTTLNFAVPSWKSNAAGQFFDVGYDDTVPRTLTILGLCQQIRAEASAMLYGTNHFKFSIGWSGMGPSPFNTVRALPQAGVCQIKACTIRIYILTSLQSRVVGEIRDWVVELCELLKRGRCLQNIEIKLKDTVQLNGRPRFETLLEPLKSLNGLKSVTVTGQVSEVYGANLKKIMEREPTKRKKRKADVGDQEEGAVPTKKTRQTKDMK